MPNHAVLGATGQGAELLDAGGVSPNEAFITVTDLGRASLIWSIPTSAGTAAVGLQRITHAGIVAVGSAGTSPQPSDGAAWWTFIEFSTMDIPIVLPPSWVTHVFWHLQDGVVADIKIYW